MARVLTGIQSSGETHLGNVLGAILPALELGNAQSEPAFFFIADLHSLTSRKEPETYLQRVYATAAAWLACGLDDQRHVFYRQSRRPEVCELAWYLNCFAPYPMLANAHSFKDKEQHLADVNAGLFTYPVLMAADILLYDADQVPVGRDQVQHLEMTRDLAGSLNHLLQTEVLKTPVAITNARVQVVPGTDGRKMSKSYGNTLQLFAPEPVLKKQVMGIVTDSLPLEAPKDPDTCHVVALYRLVAPPDAVADLEMRYRNGNYGYGHAKLALLEALLERFGPARREFDRLMRQPAELEARLVAGEQRAREVALPILERVRTALGIWPLGTS